MLEEILLRLRRNALTDADCDVLVEMLRCSAAQAAGPGSIAVGRDVNNSNLFTLVVNGGDPIALSEEIGSKLSETFRRTAPQPTNTLPEIAASFTGRATEEASIVAALTGEGGGSAAISALKGVGGVGKTALAVKIAHALTLEYPAAQLLIDLRGTGDHPSTPIEAMEKVIRAFVPLETKLPDDAAALLEIYRDLLRQNKSILILDNAKDTAQVASLLPPKPSCAIVTSRAVLSLTGAKTLRLDDLPLEDAKALLAAIMGEARPCSDAELTQLAEACLRHPLSLKVAALFLVGNDDRSISDFVELVAQDREQLRIEGIKDYDVMAVVGQSVKQLEAAEPHLVEYWRSLCVFPSNFGSGAAAAVWEIADEKATRLNITKLKTRGFVESTAADRYRLHDLMRDLARRGASQEKVAEATQRHARHFLGVLAQADEIYLQGSDRIATALALFDREWGNIAAGQSWAAGTIAVSQDVARLAAGYADAGVYVLNLRLHPREWIKWSEAALLGNQAIGDRRGEGAALGNLGTAYADLGETRKAIEHYEQQLVITREICDRRGEGNALGNLGNAYARLGETRKAIEHYEKNLAIAREIGDRRGEGAALGNLGIAYKNLGETRKAIEHHEQQLVITRAIGDRRGEGNALGNLGIAYAGLGETRKAIEHHEQDLAIAQEISDRRGEGNALGNLGNAYAALGETRKAIEHYEQRLAIAREIGDRRGEGNALTNLGWALKTSDPAATRDHWRKALAIFTQIEDPNAARVSEWLAALDGTETAS